MSEISVETRQILARYEDISAQHAARVNDIGEQFATDLARHDAEAAERDRLYAEQKPGIDAAHEAAKAEFARKQAEEQAKPTTWQRESKPTVLSFGDEEPRRPAPTPVPPVSQAPPAPPTAPEPTPTPARDRFLDFTVDEESAPQPGQPAQPAQSSRQPVKPRRPTPVEDDDDWSGRSWLR
ncbi:hypothetical protein [Actinokineospora enzanensis]|uniref:hypothetical protein n=1 Tax=Actinokineospora enzanensis TaxID=155975 RepID=UPI00035F11B0|nr:hypothetical protein [Actinokineospora enzanensis]